MLNSALGNWHHEQNVPFETWADGDGHFGLGPKATNMTTDDLYDFNNYFDLSEGIQFRQARSLPATWQSPVTTGHAASHCSSTGRADPSGHMSLFRPRPVPSVLTCVFDRWLLAAGSGGALLWAGPLRTVGGLQPALQHLLNR